MRCEAESRSESEAVGAVSLRFAAPMKSGVVFVEKRSPASRQRTVNDQ
jgi:hypothetical protein